MANEHGIYKAQRLKVKIEQETGVVISLSNIHNYLEKKPVSIRLSTIEVICTALNCNLSDILEITPGRRSLKRRKLSFKNTPTKNRIKKNAFPNPSDYVHL